MTNLLAQDLVLSEQSLRICDKKYVIVIANRSTESFTKSLTQTTYWDETAWIRRIKWASEELLAVDERLLPGFVVNRYSPEEIENENLFCALTFFF
jgi:hypothetical protein